MMQQPDPPPDLDKIVRLLGGGKKTGGGYSCKCPAHDDKHSSLSITVKDGRLLWKCHAGCDQRAVFDALKSRGLLPDRAPRPRPATSHDKPGPRPEPTGRALEAHDGGKAPKKPEPLGRIVATYDYVDVTGQLLFQVCRFEPKTFRQRRPKGSGWEWGLGRVEPVLYRLPEVLAANLVLFCEGEKDVENIRRQLKLTATTVPMGAGKWRDTYAEALTDKHVVVLPDNDPAGVEHGEIVASAAVKAGARSVRIVHLPKLPEKGDVSDWIAAGGTREEIEQIIRATPLWTEKSDDAAGDPAWRSRLIQGDRGPIGNEANVALALRSAPELTGRLRFDAFRTAVQMREMPWDPRPDWRDWTDNDDVQLAIWVQERDINYPSHRVPGVVTTVAAGQEHHPVRSYLEGLKWDGKPRLDTWVIRYLGGKEHDDPARRELTKAFGVKWMISAVARVFQPGCKADCALILEGEQGEGKSSGMSILCGQEWFTDQIADFGHKDSSHDLRGKWIIELAELKNVRGTEVEKVKAFMSRGIDHYRPSYARRSVDIPRQCVFVGSTNEDIYLHDPTGNRRFWPVPIGVIDRVALKRDRDQLWAEAYHRYMQGEEWWLPKELEVVAKAIQAERLEEDTWTAFLKPYLKGRDETTTREVLTECIGKDKRDITRSDETRVGAALRSMGFRSSEKRHHIYGTRVYVRVKGP